MKFTYSLEIECTPALPFTPLSDADKVAFSRIMAKYFVQSVEELGTAFMKITLTEIHSPAPEPQSTIL